MTLLERDIADLQNTLSPGQDLPARLRKLGEEVGELAEAIARGDRASIIEEGADVGIVVSGILSALGASFNRAMNDKMEINWERLNDYN